MLNGKQALFIFQLQKIHRCGRFFMWKAFFKARFCYCLFLFAPHFEKRNDPLNNTMLNDNDFKYLSTFGKYYLDDHSMLKSIVVCDSENQGKVRMGEEDFDIAKCRSSPTFQLGHRLNGNMWNVHVLELEFPVHRYTMIGAILHLISPTCLSLIEKEDVLKNKYH